MAKGRFVSRSISTNEQLAGVSFAADYFFTRCIAHLDVDGRLTGNPILLKSNVVPLRDEITLKMIPKLIEELGAAVDLYGRSLVVWYEIGAQRVLFFPGFKEQQKGLRVKREAPSKLPALSDKVTVLAGRIDGITPTPRRITAGSTPGVTPTNCRTDDGVRLAQGEVEVEVKAEVQVQVQAEAEVQGEDWRAAAAAAAPNVVLVAAANRGITERYGEQPVPIRHDAAASVLAAEAIATAGVPVDFARDAIYTCVVESSLDHPPRTLKYFVGHVIDRYRARQTHDTAARSDARRLPGTNGMHRPDADAHFIAEMERLQREPANG